MNKKILTIGLLLLSGALNSYSNSDYEETYIQKHLEYIDAPVPVEVIRPHLRGAPNGLQIKVLVTVDSLGRVKSAEIDSSNAERLNDQILTAVKRWRFRPAIVNGKPMERKVIIPFVNTIPGTPLVFQNQ